MTRRVTIPPELGDVFSVGRAGEAGLRRGRLRGRDLERPFHGVRRLRDDNEEPDRFAQMRSETRGLIRAYAVRMRPSEFFSHETAVVVWGGPTPAHLDTRLLQIGVHDDDPLPRTTGVRGRRLAAAMTTTRAHEGVRVASPASTWAMLGRWEVRDLVALGDHLCRLWRAGHGRQDIGRPPIATREQLEAALAAGRRIGAGRLREALALIRCDSWSPRESACRLLIVEAGLPEPVLNVDVVDDHGSFVACVDLAYPRERIAIE